MRTVCSTLAVLLAVSALATHAQQPPSRLAVSALAIQAQQPPALPAALGQMVAAERAFAKLGAEKGARDSFLVYFADDAVLLDSAPQLAKDVIRQWPAPKPGAQLLWEPRTGDIATSGDLGYLTGPVVSVASDGTRRHSCYSSVWKRQADGTFKVIMDVGVDVPQPAPFADGFTRSWPGPRFSSSAADAADAADARDTLERTERAIDPATGGFMRARQAYADALTPGTRVHRMNVLPLVGKPAIVAQLSSVWNVTRSSVRHIEVAQSGDLGWTWGTCATASADGKATDCRFVRVWGRKVSGAWAVLFDLVK